MAYLSPFTFAAVLVTVADLNREIRDNMLATHGTAGSIGARVYNSANISVTSGANPALTFNSEHSDSDPLGEIHSTSSNTQRLTCRTPGVYQISGCAEFGQHATGQRILQILLNGTTVLGTASAPVNSASVTTVLAVSASYFLAAGDYVELRVFQDSGGALNVLASGSSLPAFAMFKS